MAAVNPGERFVIGGQTVLLLALYLFLYFPIFYIGYLSVTDNTVWPFPPLFTGEWYGRLMIMSDFHTGLVNSVLIGAGTAVLSTLFATAAGDRDPALSRCAGAGSSSSCFSRRSSSPRS